jgi:anti-anti-sigma factor
MTQPLEQKTSREIFDISIDIQAREIGLVGEVDMATAPLLLTAATSLFSPHPGDLTLDLTGVTFADSALLNVIDEITGRLNVHLRLINPTAAVKRLFLAGGATHLLRDIPAALGGEEPTFLPRAAKRKSWSGGSA